jgi:nicotinamidase/pyrazinamidase
MKQALLVIDVQNDFCEGGLLAARDTATLIQPLNRALEKASSVDMRVILTRDWHPKDHSSFQQQGGPWPPHCVQNSSGAEFAVGLRVPSGSRILDKGVQRDDDGYSMFVRTPLDEWLQHDEIESIAVCGIATEYCVLESVRDGIANGFSVQLLSDLIRPIEARPGDSENALAEMEQLGAKLLTSNEWLRALP